MSSSYLPPPSKPAPLPPVGRGDSRLSVLPPDIEPAPEPPGRPLPSRGRPLPNPASRGHKTFSGNPTNNLTSPPASPSHPSSLSVPSADSPPGGSARGGRPLPRPSPSGTLPGPGASRGRGQFPGNAPPIAPRRTTTVISSVTVSPEGELGSGGNLPAFTPPSRPPPSPNAVASLKQQPGFSQSSPSLPSVSSSPQPSPPEDGIAALTVPEAEAGPPDFVPNDSLYVTRRDKIAKEILTTELSYVKSLRILVVSFLEPLEKREVEEVKGAITDADLRTLGLVSVRNILAVNILFLEGLTDTIGKNWSPTTMLGGVFKRFTPFLKMYREYTEAYETALNRLQEFHKNPANPFSVYIRTWEEKPKAFMLPLPSFLIMPVQRIPRYNLLLRDLLKETESGHPDLDGLTLALKEMEQIAGYINDSIKAADSRRRMLAVQQCLVGGGQNLIEPHRRYIREGLLIKVCRRTDKERYFALFNDALIYADPLPTPSGNAKYRFRKFIPLTKLKIFSLPDDEEGATPSSPGVFSSVSGKKSLRKNAFQLMNEQKSFVVYGTTPEEKNSWMESILDAQMGNQKATASGEEEDDYFQPIWMQDSETTRCLLCGTAFGMFTRRHHCRKCGLIFCSACTTHRVVLSRVRKEADRVCNKCYELVTGESSIDSEALASTSSPGTPS